MVADELAIARAASALASSAAGPLDLPDPAGVLARSGAALVRQGRLLELMVTASQPSTLPAADEVLALAARAVLESWLTGHALLLRPDEASSIVQARRRAQATADLPADAVEVLDLTDAAAAGTLDALARLADLALYGTVEPKKAFQRHHASFYDEIDVRDVEGGLGWLDRYIELSDRGASLRATARVEHGATEHVRVATWVTLFLAHDWFEAVGRHDDASAAFAHFGALRAATDAWYRERRARAQTHG